MEESLNKISTYWDKVDGSYIGMLLFWFCFGAAHGAIIFAVAIGTAISCSLDRQYCSVLSLSFLDVYVFNQWASGWKPRYDCKETTDVYRPLQRNINSWCAQLNTHFTKRRWSIPATIPYSYTYIGKVYCRNIGNILPPLCLPYLPWPDNIRNDSIMCHNVQRNLSK